MANLYRWTEDELDTLEQAWAAMTHDPLDWGVFHAATREEAQTFLIECIDKSVAFAEAQGQAPTYDLWQVLANFTSENSLTVAVTGNGLTSEANARAICYILTAFPYLLSTVRAYREMAVLRRQERAGQTAPLVDQLEEARAMAQELGRHVPPALTLFDDGTPTRSRIVCLCGSTRFWKTFQVVSLAETLANRIVLSIGAASGTDDAHFGGLPKAEYDQVKAALDELHLRKIDLCDEVLVLNVDGYIGESTAREIAYARQLGKPIRWWEVPTVGSG